MLVFNKIRSCLCSKPVRTLFWLLLATAFCVLIVISLSSAKAINDHDVSTENIVLSPTPKKGGLILVEPKNPLSIDKWTNKLKTFLLPYTTAQNKPHEKQVDCSFDKYPIGTEVCTVDIKNFTPCTEHNDFGYGKAAPCIFLKFKKRINWIPQYLDAKNIEKARLSKDVAQDIKENYEQQKPEVLKTIWVSCEGKTPFDTELMGKVNYVPWKGFPGYYFPSHELNWYLSPLVAVHFENPRTKIPIDIACMVVAGNFNETVSFKLLIEDD